LSLKAGYDIKNVKILWNGSSQWIQLGYPLNVGTPTTLS